MRPERADIGPDLSWITSTYFDDFQDSAVINDGWCYLWAWIGHVATDGRLFTYDGYTRSPRIRVSHAFLQVGDLFYDSSRPRGTAHWRNLSYFGGKPRKRAPREMEPTRFQDHWGLRAEKWRDQGLLPWPTTLPGAVLVVLPTYA